MMPSQAIRAADVTNALGVQTDLQVGNWSTISAMITQTQYIGATSVRVGVVNPSNGAYVYFEQLAHAGLKMDFVVDPTMSPSDNVAAIAGFAALHPGSIALVEGPNEPNNWGVNYNGLNGVAGAEAWQTDFYSAMKSNTQTASIEIAGVSSYPVVNVASDENNLHEYPSAAGGVGTAIAADLRTQEAVSPGKGFAITEMGWSTDPNATNGVVQGVDELTQAKLTLDAYLDASSLGATHVGLYELRDWNFTDFGAYYGLFHADGTPKVVATALHNMQGILSDPSSAANTFVPGSLNYSIAGGSDVNTLLTEKSDGTYVLALWREPTIWNASTGTEVTVSGEAITVSVDNISAISSYSPIDSATALSSATAKSLTVTLSDEPVFLTIANAPASTSSIPSSTSILGTAGNDSLVANSASSTIQGMAGSDVIVSQSGNAHIYGNALNSSAGAVDGNDTITAASGTNYINGNAGNDLITVGGNGVNRVYGGQGDDHIVVSGGGNARANGNIGNDLLDASASTGDNVLHGGQDNDVLRAGHGHDQLFGDLGDDTLVAGTGSSHVAIMTGGAGADLFDFSHGAANVVSISGTTYYQEVTDFTPGTDHIGLAFAVGGSDVASSAQSFADVQSAQSYAQQLLSSHGDTSGVAALQVGHDTYLFYDAAGSSAAIDSVVKLDGVIASTVTSSSFSAGVA